MHVVEPPRVSVVMAIDHVHDPTVYIDREAISRVPPVALFLVDWFNLFNAHFILPFFYVLNYVGWWNTLGYLFVEYIFWRDIIYIIIGLTMLYSAELLLPMESTSSAISKEWLLGMPSSFSFKRKFLHFLQSQYHFFGSCIFWTGAWDLFDIFLWEASPRRDIIYGVVTIAFTFIFEQLVSRESLVWFAGDKSNRKPVQLESVTINDDDDHIDHHHRGKQAR